MIARPSRAWLALSLGLCACAGSAPGRGVAPSASKAALGRQSQGASSAVIATDVPALARPVTSFGAAAHQGALYLFVPSVPTSPASTAGKQ